MCCLHRPSLTNESLLPVSESLEKSLMFFKILEKTTMWMILSNSSKKMLMNTANSIATGFSHTGRWRICWLGRIEALASRSSFCLKSRIFLTASELIRSCFHKSRLVLECSRRAVPSGDVGMVFACNTVKTSAGFFVPSDGLLRVSVRFALLEPLED